MTARQVARRCTQYFAVGAELFGSVCRKALKNLPTARWWDFLIICQDFVGLESEVAQRLTSFVDHLQRTTYQGDRRFEIW